MIAIIASPGSISKPINFEVVLNKAIPIASFNTCYHTVGKKGKNFK